MLSMLSEKYEQNDKTTRNGIFCAVRVEVLQARVSGTSVVTVNYRPVLSSERALQNNKPAAV
jgi:hypothetical protein